MPAEAFRRRFINLILLAWLVPAVFGLSYILYIQLLTVEQMVLVMTRPLEPAFILASNLFAFWYFRRFSQPLQAWLKDPGSVEAALVEERLRAFPLHFWANFLLYLVLAPSSVILSAELYSDYVAAPVDWFRIHLVALVVAIIVGLPIFFQLLDLFGQAFGKLRLTRPQTTLKAKVFLIGALMPLLIDTMIVQYYWTRTGFFSSETFVIWLGLEIVAILGALMFMRSIAQSLRPLDRMVDSLYISTAAGLASVAPESTDELGLLTARFLDLLKEREASAAVGRIAEQLLNADRQDTALADFIDSLVQLTGQVIPGDQVFLFLFDPDQGDLKVVAMTGASYRPEGHYRIGLDEASLAVWAFRQRETAVISNLHGDARVSPRMLAAFPAHSAIAAPLWAEGEVIGTLLSANTPQPVLYGDRDVAMFEVLARETALALHAYQLRETRERADRSRQRQQELLELLTASASEGIYTVNTDGYCTFVNPAALTMLGYGRKEDLLGENIHALIHHTYPDGRAYPKEHCRVRLSTREGKNTHVDDEVHWRADGSSFPVEYWSRPMYQDGELVGAVVTFVDVSQRRRAEAALRESEARYRLISSVTSDVLYSCSRASSGHFVIDWAAGTVDKVFGLSSDELIARRCWRCLVHDQDLPIFDRQITELKPGQSSDVELRIVRPDGAVRYLRAYSKVLEGSDAEQHRLFGACQDITAQKQAEATLRDSEERYRTLVDNMPGAVYRCEVEVPWRITVMSDEVEPLTGYKAADFLREGGVHWADLVLAEDLPELEATVAKGVRDKAVYRATYRIRRKGGEARHVFEQGRAVYGQDGQAKWLDGVILDISERTHAEEALRASEERFRVMAEQSADWIWSLDTQGHHTYSNQRVSALLGYALAEFLAMDPVGLVHPDDRERFLATFRHALAAKEGWKNVVLRWRHRDGHYLSLESSATAVFDKHGDLSGFQGVDRDISERRQAEERIQFMAHHDALTGLPNRILLRDRFEQAHAFAERAGSHVALLFMDLDNFKVVNDTLGHAAGDRLLLAVVARLNATLRETDTISRQGGDEFIILLNDIRDSETVERIAGQMLQHLAEPVTIDGYVLNISGSIGISLFPEDGADFDSLLLKADTAMYTAKESGRNAYRFFDEAMNKQAREHLLLQNRLHQALVKGEFHLHYQPQVAVDSGRVFGVEALLRWRSPELGEVPPARFIPVAEDSGLVVPIGSWVLEQACQQAAAWHADGLSDLSISVNLSAVQFRRHNLVEHVAAALEKSGLPAHLLELELTESILLQDVEHTLDTVRHLKALGVRLSIDDFGTGYSSLSYLKRFAVDKLKIDQSFVRDLDVDPDDAAIVRAIIQLARSLRLGIIAEGVESEAQLDFLRREGCPEVQGYLISRPLPPGELEAFLRRQG